MSRGRKRHASYSQLNFTPKKLNSGKMSAVCNVCQRSLKNTSIERLYGHRKICLQEGQEYTFPKATEMHDENVSDTNKQDIWDNSDSDSSEFEESNSSKCIKLEKNIVINNRGRKRHSLYSQLNFTPKKLDSGKMSAVCNVCNRSLKNTSIERLRVHRNLCTQQDSDGTVEETELDLSTKNIIGLKRNISGTNRGRKCHSLYLEYKFTPKKLESGKMSAVCHICRRCLKNTSIERLRTHRKHCIGKDGDSIETNKDMEGDLFKKEESDNSNSEDTKSLMDIKNNDLWESLDDKLECDNASSDEEDPTYDPSTSKTSSLHSLVDKRPLKRHKKIFNNFRKHYIGKDGDSFEMNKDMEGDLFKKEESDNSNSEDTKILMDTKMNDPSISKTSSLHSLVDKRPLKRHKKYLFDSATPQIKSKQDISLAKFFYGCKIPFAVVESVHFIKFLKLLCPTYTPPTRSFLSNTSLDELNTKLKNSSTYESSNTKDVVTMLHCIGTSGVFLKCHEFSTLRETGETLENICEKSISDVKLQYNCEIYAIICDNADMIKMKCLSNLWNVPCINQTSNLWAKDIADTNVFNEVIQILKEFQSPELENSVLSKGGSKLILPTETQVFSQRDACKSFFSNLNFMIKVVDDGYDKIEHSTSQNLNNERFLEDVKIIMDILDPLCELIDKCQNGEFLIADATEEWLKLELQISRFLKLKSQKELDIKNKLNMALTIYGLAANLFHPSYRGKLINKNQLKDIQDFIIDSLDSESLDGYNEFLKETGIFNNLKKKDVTKPLTYWGLVEVKYPSLSALALKLLKIPASFAQLEKMLLKNGLSLEKCEKLMFLYHS